MTILNYGLHSYTRLIDDCFDLTAALAWRSHFRHNFIGIRPVVNCVPRELNEWCGYEGFSDDCCLFTINYQPFTTLRDYYISWLKSDMYNSVNEVDYELTINHWLTYEFTEHFNHQIFKLCGNYSIDSYELFEPPKLFDIPTGVVSLC